MKTKRLFRPDSDLIRRGNDGTWIPYEDVINSSVMLSLESRDQRERNEFDAASDSSPAGTTRVGSAFLVTIPFTARNYADSYTHSYIVTAAHCAFGANYSPMNLIEEGNWMGGQGGSSYRLPKDDWRLTKQEDLRDGEDRVDLAFQRYRGPSYSGFIIGKATCAIPIGDLVDIERHEYDSHPPLGLETATVGLLSHFNYSDRIEPAMLFGRLVLAPTGPVLGRNEEYESLFFVESSAAQGMSGAPVFARTGDPDRDAQLIGVHVGHYLIDGNTQARQIGFTQDSRIGLVVPISRLHDMLYSPEQVADREQVEAEVISSPWRFLDRRHRERTGISCMPEYYSNMTDYEDEHPLLEDNYLFINPSETSGQSDWWNQTSVGILASIPAVRHYVESYFGEVTWRGNSASGNGRLTDGTPFYTVGHVNGTNRLEALTVGFEEDAGPSPSESRENCCRALADQFGWICISSLADERIA